MKRRKREKKQKVQLRHLFDRLSQKCICFCIIWVDRLKVKTKVKFVFFWHWEENWRGFSQKIRNKSSIQHKSISNSTQLPCILTKHKIQNTPILLSLDQFVTSHKQPVSGHHWRPVIGHQPPARALIGQLWLLTAPAPTPGPQSESGSGSVTVSARSRKWVILSNGLHSEDLHNLAESWKNVDCYWLGRWRDWSGESPQAVTGIETQLCP